MFYQQFPTFYETHTRVVAGVDCIGQLPDELHYYKASKVLIVSDPQVSRTAFYERCLARVGEAGCPYLTYNDVEEEAPLRNVETVRGLLVEGECDLIIAVGGGSVIDVCKAGSVLAKNGGKPQDWAGYEKYSIPPVTLFTIPTTAGTSSEVTNMAVVHDEENHVKFTIGHRVLGAAKVTFLDGRSIASCPRSVIAQSGIDALSHSFESYIALRANPITEALALQGVRLISHNLRLVYGNSDNAFAALDLLVGSAMGGLAFNTTGCGNMHCIGRHIGPQFGVNHGTSVALVMPAVARFNFPAQMEKYRDLARAMDLKADHLPLAEVGEVVVEGLKRLIRDVGITKTLADMNPTPQDFEDVARDSYKVYRMFYHYRNPTKMCEKDYIRILEDCR